MSLAWHTAFLPHMKKPPKLHDLMVGKAAERQRGPQSPQQINLTMRRWRAAQAAVVAGQPGKRR